MMKKWAPLIAVLCIALYLRCSTSPVVPSKNMSSPSIMPSAPQASSVPSTPSDKESSRKNRFEALHTNLPRLDVVRNASEEEIHHGAPGVNQGADVLGEVATQLRADAKAIPEGVEFYRRCARDESVITSVRAVCLKRLGEWASRAAPPIRVKRSEFPADLQELADQLP